MSNPVFKANIDVTKDDEDNVTVVTKFTLWEVDGEKGIEITKSRVGEEDPLYSADGIGVDYENILTFAMCWMVMMLNAVQTNLVEKLEDFEREGTKEPFEIMARMMAEIVENQSEYDSIREIFQILARMLALFEKKESLLSIFV